MSFASLVDAMDREVMSELGGETVIYAPSPLGLPFALGAPFTLSPVSITGIFDDQFVLAKGDAHAGVEATGPAIFVRLEDLPTDPEVDNPTLTIRGGAYRVIERMPDGLGGIVLAVRLIT